MAEHLRERRAVSRITCMVNRRLSPRITQRLGQLGVHTVFIETGRSVREVHTRRRFRLPGRVVRIEDSPVEVFRFTVPREAAERVMHALIVAAELDAPGHGTIYAQDLMEFSRAAPPALAAQNGPSSVEGGSEEAASGGVSEKAPVSDSEPAGGGERPRLRSRVSQVRRTRARTPTLLRDLTALTCILSMPESGEQISKIALELGTCVPIVTLGIGTGIRDRLGLLRITVPQDKEVVHLLVPSYDAVGITRLLIEEGRLNRPGRGFLYHTPVRAALIDTRLRVGRHGHAASMEQIIAAVDELKAGTAWRKRFPGLELEDADATHQLRRENREITVICSEGGAERLVSAAMEAGAGGATTARVRRVKATDAEGGIAARERSTIAVAADVCERVVGALLDVERGGAPCADRVQVLEAPAAFSHRS